MMLFENFVVPLGLVCAAATSTSTKARHKLETEPNFSLANLVPDLIRTCFLINGGVESDLIPNLGRTPKTPDAGQLPPCRPPASTPSAAGWRRGWPTRPSSQRSRRLPSAACCARWQRSRGPTRQRRTSWSPAWPAAPAKCPLKICWCCFVVIFGSPGVCGIVLPTPKPDPPPFPPAHSTTHPWVRGAMLPLGGGGMPPPTVSHISSGADF